MLVQKQLNLNLQLNRKRKEKLSKIENPKLKINIKKKIETMRRQMSILSKIERNKAKKARNVMKKYQITSTNGIPSIKKELKQKLKVKAQSERRFDKCNKIQQEK